METANRTLRRLRRERDLTLKTIAERTGFSISYVSAIETGNRSLTLDNVSVFADALTQEDPETKEEIQATLMSALEADEHHLKEARAEQKSAVTAKTLRAFERDIYEGLRILRGGRIEDTSYKLLEQEGFDIRDHGRTLARRSIIEVDGELFEVEFALARVEKDAVSDGFIDHDLP
ncbi:MAG: helix-turn-helix domain-containing protein [Verrucomicrobiae bacterium]|nr:helix-turn-helix domain-containing protein [Verrucomicrobiae bacterium]